MAPPTCVQMLLNDSGALAATIKQKHHGIVWNAQILGLVGAGCLVFSKFEEIDSLSHSVSLGIFLAFVS